MNDFQKIWLRQSLTWFAVVLIFGIFIWKYPPAMSVTRALIMGVIGGYVMAMIEWKSRK